MIAPVLPVYRRSDIVMARGEGCYLFDDTGKRYLDFATGIAVNALGHCHPSVTHALKEQADTLWHCSNLYRVPALERFASKLVDATFADTVFFCSSGTEAVEAAVKMIRRHHWAKGNGRWRIITFEGGFHGRTYTGISAGGNDKAREGFAPLLEGFDRVAFGDLAAVERAVSAETAAIMIEPIQGEGGIRVAGAEFLRGLRALANRHGLLLMCDEVQCGMGRSGTLFAHEQAGIAPDLMTVAKGIGNGFPLAALLATEHAASAMTPGSHGSTYGANPLAMRVGEAVLEVMLAPGFLPNVREMGEALSGMLQRLAERFPRVIAEVRGRGLMLGLRVHGDHYALAGQLRQAGLLTAPAVSDAVIRILPPLILGQAQIDEAESIFSSLLEKTQ